MSDSEAAFDGVAGRLTTRERWLLREWVLVEWSVRRINEGEGEEVPGSEENDIDVLELAAVDEMDNSALRLGEGREDRDLTSPVWCRWIVEGDTEGRRRAC